MVGTPGVIELALMEGQCRTRIAQPTSRAESLHVNRDKRKHSARLFTALVVLLVAADSKSGTAQGKHCAVPLVDVTSRMRLL
jgi:hypothetical protein